MEKLIVLSKMEKIIAAISLVPLVTGAILSRFAFVGVPVDLLSFGLMAAGGIPLFIIFAVDRARANSISEKTHEIHYDPQTNQYSKLPRAK